LNTFNSLDFCEFVGFFTNLPWPEYAAPTELGKYILERFYYKDFPPTVLTDGASVAASINVGAKFPNAVGVASL
jgi:hypothetical protein